MSDSDKKDEQPKLLIKGLNKKFKTDQNSKSKSPTSTQNKSKSKQFQIKRMMTKSDILKLLNES